MGKLKQYLWVFITIVILGIYWLFKSVSFSTKKENTVIQNNTSVVDSLRGVIKSNEEKYKTELSALNDSIKMYKFLIDRNNQKINQIKTKTDEKVNNSTTLNANELYQFLSDRYRDSIRVKRQYCRITKTIGNLYGSRPYQI